jgi:hypothetical protein
MAVAERAAAVYAGNRKLAALAVAGSVGAGLADRFSDLELDSPQAMLPGATRTASAQNNLIVRHEVVRFE